MAKLSKEEFNELIKITDEKQVWLKTVAQTCLAHKTYMETLGPDEATTDDEGLAALSEAFLYAYGLLLHNKIIDKH